MTAILDLPEARAQVRRTSVEEFHRNAAAGLYSKRTELVRGMVLEKMSISPLHRRLGLRLYDHLKALRLAGTLVFHESPLTLADSEPQPDVMAVSGTDEDFKNSHPTTAELVIEVAVSSEALDRATAALYAEAGVKEYWIVLAMRQQVEVYRHPHEGEYLERRIYAGNEELVCRALPAVRMALPALFA